METNIFCQSCTMPIDSIADRGSEKMEVKTVSIVNIAIKMAHW